MKSIGVPKAQASKFLAPKALDVVGDGRSSTTIASKSSSSSTHHVFSSYEAFSSLFSLLLRHVQGKEAMIKVMVK
jgi:hypothetical protein